MFDAPARQIGQDSILIKLYIVYESFLVYDQHLAESVPLIFQTSLLISVKDRQEHGQDVYTAECKHFPWPSLNKKSSKSPV